jgi:hypothetical protein
MMLPKLSEVLERTETFEDSIRNVLENYTSMMEVISRHIISLVVHLCQEALMLTKNIPSQYRMTNKDVRHENG